MFCLATGCLQWSPRDAWETPVPQIIMAWEARVEFLRASNPFGQGEPPKSKAVVAQEARMGFRIAARRRPADPAA